MAPIDGFALASIMLKAAGYAAALLAMGDVLFCIVFAKRAQDDVLGLAKRIAVLAALIGLAVLAMRFGLRAARISGMGWQGAIDPTMLSLIWDSPLGSAAIWRGLGEIAILALLLPGLGRWIAMLGAVAIAVSFTQVGHTTGEPRAVLAAFLVLHVLTAAFWVGALAPLRRAALAPDCADLLHRFGQVAVGSVPLLALAGLGMTWLLSGTLSGMFGTAYGWFLIVKVMVVAGLTSLAAINKLRLVPALRNNAPTASKALRRSIAWEGIAVGAILIATATITTVTTPPANF